MVQSGVDEPGERLGDPKGGWVVLGRDGRELSRFDREVERDPIARRRDAVSRLTRTVQMSAFMVIIWMVAYAVGTPPILTYLAASALGAVGGTLVAWVDPWLGLAGSTRRKMLVSTVGPTSSLVSAVVFRQHIHDPWLWCAIGTLAAGLCTLAATSAFLLRSQLQPVPEEPAG